MCRTVKFRLIKSDFWKALLPKDHPKKKFSSFDLGEKDVIGEGQLTMQPWWHLGGCRHHVG